jgi:hypothetical protein
VSGINTPRLISERRSAMGVDMRLDNTFVFPNDVDYRYYEYANSCVIFDIKTFTNPMLHLSNNTFIEGITPEGYDWTEERNIDIDFVFQVVLLISSSRYARFSKAMDDIEAGLLYDEDAITAFREYSSRDYIVEAHDFLSEIPFDITILKEMLVRMKAKVSLSLFSNTVVKINTELGIRWVGLFEQKSDTTIELRRVKNIRKANFAESYFLGTGTLNSGNFGYSFFGDNITPLVGAEFSRMEFNLFLINQTLFAPTFFLMRFSMHDKREPIVPPSSYKIETIQGYSVEISNKTLYDGVSGVREILYTNEESGHIVLDVKQTLLRYSLQKEILPYYQSILRSFSNNYSEGIVGTTCFFCEINIIDDYPIFETFENIFKVSINMADKHIIEDSDDFVQAKLLLTKPAFTIDNRSNFMKFNISSSSFNQPVIMNFENTNVFENIDHRANKGEPGIAEKKLVDSPPSPIEKKKEPLEICSIRGLPYLEYIAFDHIAYKGKNTHIGNFSYELRELMNSGVITEGRFESITPERKISESDIFKRSLKSVVISEFQKKDLNPEWDVENFALEESDFANSNMSKDDISESIGAFDRIQLDMLSEINKEVEMNLESEEAFYSENHFPSTPDRIIDDGFLSKKHRAQQFFKVTEEED